MKNSDFQGRIAKVRLIDQSREAVLDWIAQLMAYHLLRLIRDYCVSHDAAIDQA